MDCISGLPLYEKATPANMPDASVVPNILQSANAVLPFRECTFLGDKGYNEQSIYDLAKEVSYGEAVIPLNKRNTKNPGKLPVGNLICDAGFSMNKDGKASDENGGLRQKFCCPFRQSKTGSCSCNHAK